LANSITKALKLAVPLILGVALVWYSLSKVSINDLVDYFKDANYTYIALGLLFGFLSHLSRAYRWKFLIEPLGYTLRLPNSIMAVFATYLVNYTIPRAGEVMRATVISNYEGIPFEKGFGTIVSERIADLTVMFIIIAFTLALEFDFIFQFISERFDFIRLLGIGALMLILAVFAFLFIKNSNLRIATKLRSFSIGLVEGVLSILRMKKKWAFIFHTFFIWTMYVLMFYITTFALPETSNLPLAAVLIGFIAASFSIAATNGGIGSYPIAVYGAFSLFAIAREPAIAIGWILWSSQTLMIVLLGGLSLILLPIYNRIK